MENKTIFIDSSVDLPTALAQNPEYSAPKDILSRMRILKVEYFNFDNKLHQGQIVMREDLVDDVNKFFKLILELKFPIKSVIPISHPKYKWSDEISCNDNNSSGFNYRLISGSKNRLSQHALGLAFDINPVQNIYVRYNENLEEIFRAPKDGVYDPKTPGTLTSNHSLVRLMKKLGWDWGGDWTPKTGREDYQHFEKKL